MKALVISIAVLVFVGAVTGFTLMYGQGKATKLPANSPTAFLKTEPSDQNRSVVAFVGDSLTHGAVSANYVDALALKLDEQAPQRFELINAGVNAELSYNVLLRLDEVIACTPDFVVVMIGTNDANALMSPENLERYMEQQALPQVPDAEWFRRNLRKISSRLQSETDAVIVFLSLPTMGEDPEHPAYRLSKEYSLIIKDVASEQGVFYIPLFETMDAYLNSRTGTPKYDYSQTRSLTVKGVFKHYVLGQSWDRIGESNGFILHTDFLHLNEEGAEMVTGLVADFLLQQSAVQ